MGEGQKSGAGGKRTGESAAGGTLEPDQFSTDLSWQGDLYGSKSQVRNLPADGMVREENFGLTGKVQGRKPNGQKTPLYPDAVSGCKTIYTILNFC